MTDKIVIILTATVDVETRAEFIMVMMNGPATQITVIATTMEDDPHQKGTTINIAIIIRKAAIQATSVTLVLENDVKITTIIKELVAALIVLTKVL